MEKVGREPRVKRRSVSIIPPTQDKNGITAAAGRRAAARFSLTVCSTAQK